MENNNYNKKQPPNIIGFIILSFLFAFVLSLFFNPLFKISFERIYLISLISLLTGYFFIFLRYYRIEAFYFSIICIFLLSIIFYLVNSAKIYIPDPHKYLAAYIVLGVLIGISLSIGFLYIFYHETDQQQ